MNCLVNIRSVQTSPDGQFSIGANTLLADAVQLAYSLWPDASEYTWQGMTAVAFDGSKPVRRFRDSKPPSMRYQNGGLPIGESALQLFLKTGLKIIKILTWLG